VWLYPSSDCGFRVSRAGRNAVNSRRGHDASVTRTLEPRYFDNTSETSSALNASRSASISDFKRLEIVLVGLQFAEVDRFDGPLGNAESHSAASRRA